MTTGGPPRLDYDPTSPLVATGNLARRQRVSRVVDFLSVASAVIAVAMLFWLIGTVFVRGHSAISWNFLTSNENGGESSAIVGTIAIVFVGALIATPLGVLTAVYLTEFAGPGSRLGRILTRALNLLQSLPTIVIGVFVYQLLVYGGSQSGFAGSLALSIVMMPLIARSAQEVLLRVPQSLREAGDALGVDRWRTTITVVLPTASGGILTGMILAIARAAGETAPLLLCDSVFNAAHTSVNVFKTVPNIPLTIFTLTQNPDPNAVTDAWGLALVLVTIILVANIGARVLLARSRKRTGT